MRASIPRTDHRLVDLTLVAALLLTPYLLGLGQLPVARAFFWAMAIWVAAYGALRSSLPFRTHRRFDVVTGLFIAVAPWALGYEPLLTPGQVIAHPILGALLTAGAVFTRDEPAAAHDDASGEPGSTPTDRAA